MNPDKTYEFIATTAFGLESVTASELRRMGFQDLRTENGKITFKTDLRGMVKANLRLRTADRVLLKMGEFKATTFDSLFEGTKRLDWAEWISEDGKFPVSKAKSVKAVLYSLSDSQAIVKKAVVESLKEFYDVNWFLENGKDEYSIMVSNLKDTVTLTIDTTGIGLHKRGYRQNQNSAPIKETLAAAMVLLSKWHPDRTLYDPFCGSGTIPIEAAMIGMNMAPGINRTFAFQNWSGYLNELFKEERRLAMAEIDHEKTLHIEASDIDYFSIKMAKENAENMGVDHQINFQKLDFKDFSSKKKYAYVITNPPYGERMGEKKECEALYRMMGEKFLPNTTWSMNVITSHEGFEKLFGLKGKNRKLYNGKIKTYYYQYLGPVPPRKEKEQPSL